MRPESQKYRVTGFDVAMKYLGIVMAIVYVITGVVVLLKPRDLLNIPDEYSIPLGCVMIAYGLYRGYRNYQKYFQK